MRPGLAEPPTRVGGAWLGGFGLAWLGVWLAQLTAIQLLLPEQVADVGRGGWLQTVARFGWVSAAAGVVALVALPLAGALSDRTTGRFGRRRPWIAVGTLLYAAGLAALGLQHDAVGVAVAWSVALGGFSVVAAALTAMIADRVPVRQRGVASAAVFVPQAVGTILGIALVTALGLPIAAAYAVTAGLLVVLVLPFLLAGGDPPAGPVRLPGTAGAVLRSVWIDPHRHPDFAWTLAGRVLVNLGNALGTTLLLYFLADGLHVPHADDALLPLVGVYLLCLVVATVVCGRASDLSGRRRPFVAIAAGLQAIAAVQLAVVPSYSSTLVGAAFLGAGYGVFLSVDQALATQVLPDAASRGKDLGVMNVATVVPQAFGPIVGAAVLAVTASFPALFAAAAVLSAAGAVCVARVRSVR